MIFTFRGPMNLTFVNWWCLFAIDFSSFRSTIKGFFWFRGAKLDGFCDKIKIFQMFFSGTLDAIVLTSRGIVLFLTGKPLLLTLGPILAVSFDLIVFAFSDDWFGEFFVAVMFFVFSFTSFGMVEVLLVLCWNGTLIVPTTWRKLFLIRIVSMIEKFDNCCEVWIYLKFVDSFNFWRIFNVFKILDIILFCLLRAVFNGISFKLLQRLIILDFSMEIKWSFSNCNPTDAESWNLLCKGSNCEWVLLKCARIVVFMNFTRSIDRIHSFTLKIISIWLLLCEFRHDEKLLIPLDPLEIYREE